MKGQVFTVAKIHYVNGVVYFTAQKGKTDLQHLANNFKDTTKSGKVKHPLVRVRTLSRLAEGIGLVNILPSKQIEITELGKSFYEARLTDKWKLSEAQKDILGSHMLSDNYRTETIYAITTLLRLYKSGYVGSELAHRFAIEIGKDEAWQSEVTYEGFTRFGLNFLDELGLLDIDEKDLLLEDISKESRYQETVNKVESILIPEGELPRPKPKKYGGTAKFHSNPRRSKNALIAAEFKCELGKSHATFINKTTHRQYMEAHHLIPMSKQASFPQDIDVPENILCLCPNCHRKIHFAEDTSRIDILKRAYERKKRKLPSRGISIGFDELLTIYGIGGGAKM